MHVWLDHDNYSHRFYLNDTLTESQAAGHTIDYIYEKDVDAIFGSPKSLCTLLVLFTHTHSFFWTWYYSYCFFSIKCSVTPIERTSLPGLWDTSFYVHLYPGCPCEICMWIQVRVWLCVCKCVLSYTWACLNVRSTKQKGTRSYVVMPKHFSGYFSVVKQ